MVNVRNNISPPQLLQKKVHPSDHAAVQEKNVPLEKDSNATDLFSDKEKLKQVTESMNEFMKPTNTSLRFEFHEKLQEYYVTLVDTTTKEVVKEIPPKKMLDLYASIAESLGWLVDEKI
ncbi:flagellar protein FlaG [Halobacillus fulvus]|nr:flagellar protein FlaG [Halobacillus fulvus]